MNKLVGMIVASLLAVGSALPAVADSSVTTDEQDTNDVMDLAAAGHAHGSRANILVHRITTHQAWTNTDFRGARIVFWLPDQDRAPDRSLLVDLNPDDSLRAYMINNKGLLLGYANVFRSAERTLKVEFPVRDRKSVV